MPCDTINGETPRMIDEWRRGEERRRHPSKHASNPQATGNPSDVKFGKV
jgi:hypothetical protein